MIIKQSIASVRVVVNCDDHQEKQASALLAKLHDLGVTAPGLRDGGYIRFGCLDLKLVDVNGELVVHEPDYTKDPFPDYIPGVSETLNVLEDQVYWLTRLQMTPFGFHFSQTVLVLKECLNEKDVYLERTEDDDPSSSGWYVGATNRSTEVNADDVEEMFVYQLYAVRPSLISVLSFPIGFMALFSGDILQAVFNEDGMNVLQQSFSH